MTLDKVPVGSKVKIKNIFESNIKHRLLGMGLIPNTIIEVVHTSPMGDPRAYRVFNKLITLRNTEASKIEVEFLEDYIPLSAVSEGEYIVSGFLGGHRFLRKVANLGLKTGLKITLKNSVVYINGKKIALGHGMKEKIFLRRL
ncbi:FeoA domain-containing protein [Thermosipho atlanticus]|uniref:Ferrous iron transport protein A n=1 Tax=Thermosipho atlanticus DSM 15807 TaxID=1123380 RepID=A0A1M5SUA8_9BACT|nr:FeoA domain-containing protein [Thermosipho atlanticus]SHH41563.1 ferrous iron transport protein A [Thermosipho atlanticus DSM 15807]